MPRTLCPFADPCGLSRSIGMVAALRVWQSFYCEGAYGRCERYRLHESGQGVPRRLLPNGRLLDGPEETTTPAAPAEPRDDGTGPWRRPR